MPVINSKKQQGEDAAVSISTQCHSLSIQMCLIHQTSFHKQEVVRISSSGSQWPESRSFLNFKLSRDSQLVSSEDIL